jgi:hypothetical protein
MLDPVSLSTKIVAYIAKNEGVTYEALKERARVKGIEQGVFDNAIARIHKNKKILVKNQEGVLTYGLRPVVVATPSPHLTWCRENYPWPGKDGIPEFVMPFPEIDFSWIFLRPEELQEYKAKIKGLAFRRKKTYEYKKD